MNGYRRWMGDLSGCAQLLPSRGEEDMRRRLMLVATICCSAAACMGAVAATAGATGPGGGAGIAREGGSICLTSDGTSSWWFSCQFKIVFQPNGGITEYEEGSVMPLGPSGFLPSASSPLPSRATALETGVPCLTFDGVVYTVVVAGEVTPSGQVTEICKS